VGQSLRQYEALKRGGQPDANQDLWKRLRAALAARKAPFELVWSRAHAEAKRIVDGVVKAEDAVANYLADALAARAADEEQVGEAEASKVLRARTLTQKIQHRAAAAIQLQGSRPKPQKAKQAFPPNLVVMAAISSGHELEELPSGGYRCVSCEHFSLRGAAKLKAWLAEGCEKPGPVASSAQPQAVAAHGKLHQSHNLAAYKGLYFCDRCGAYGSGRPRRLLESCRPPAPGTEGPKRHLGYAARLTPQGKLPAGLLSWPEDAAQEQPQQQLAAQGDQQGPPTTEEEKKARRQYRKQAAAQAQAPLPFAVWLEQHRAGSMVQFATRRQSGEVQQQPGALPQAKAASARKGRTASPVPVPGTKAPILARAQSASPAVWEVPHRPKETARASARLASGLQAQSSPSQAGGAAAARPATTRGTQSGRKPFGGGRDGLGRQVAGRLDGGTFPSLAREAANGERVPGIPCAADRVRGGGQAGGHSSRSRRTCRSALRRRSARQC